MSAHVLGALLFRKPWEMSSVIYVSPHCLPGLAELVVHGLCIMLCSDVCTCWLVLAFRCRSDRSPLTASVRSASCVPQRCCTLDRPTSGSCALRLLSMDCAQTGKRGQVVVLSIPCRAEVITAEAAIYVDKSLCLVSVKPAEA